MSPITEMEFKQGNDPAGKTLQVDILAVLQQNPSVAISAVELENMFNKRRQVIHQALKALESKGLVIRGFVKERNRNVCYVTLRTEDGTDGKA